MENKPHLGKMNSAEIKGIPSGKFLDDVRD